MILVWAAAMPVEIQRIKTMPIYEFECQDCQARTSIFVRTVSSEVSGACAACGSKRLVRVISRFGVSRSTKSVHDRHTNPSDPSYFTDPRNIGRTVERQFAQMGMDIPDQVRQTIDAARDGVMPGPVKDLQPNVTQI